MKHAVLFSGLVAILVGGCATKSTIKPVAVTKAVSEVPEGFVALRDIDPTIVQEMRYAGNHNFIGHPIDGYRAGRCILTRPAAEALAKAQSELRLVSLSLKIYDCYRPQRAVDEFVKWARDLGDKKMKAEFYPKVEKTNLFKDGYIDAKSGHSRGSTVDLTVVPLPLPDSEPYHPGDKLRSCLLPEHRRFDDGSIDMGTGYDCFDPKANTDNATIEKSAKKNRQTLRAALERQGFKNYPMEWWHFTLKNEPFPETYFDFAIPE